MRNVKPHIPKSSGSRQSSNAVYGSGAWRDRHDRPSLVQAGRQGGERRVKRAMRHPRTPGAVRSARGSEQDGRNKDGPRHEHVPRRQ